MKQILWLQVSMEVASLVQISQSSQKLLHQAFYLVARQTIGPSVSLLVLNVVEYCAREILKNQVEVFLNADHLF